jgi:putative ABC transport system substrate-binding protein
MRRRDFIKGIVGSASVWPLAARAQQPASPQRLGYLSDESSSVGAASFDLIASVLRESGRNVHFESRYADGKNDALPVLAEELVRLKPDVIVSVGTPATRAARKATDTIPIVFSRIADPIALGLVATLARPGGNLTGVSVITQDLAAKRLEMLVEVVPGVTRVGVLLDPTFPSAPLELKEIERAAQLLNVEIQPTNARRAEELEAAVQAVVTQRGQALMVVPGPLFTEHRQRVAEIALKNRLPTILSRREHVEAGGLMSYGTNYSEMYRRAATYAVKILKGAKPSDLPVEQPTRLELVINLKTAKVLGLTLPINFQARADDVIE